MTSILSWKETWMIPLLALCLMSESECTTLKSFASKPTGLSVVDVGEGNAVGKGITMEGGNDNPFSLECSNPRADVTFVISNSDITYGMRDMIKMLLSSTVMFFNSIGSNTRFSLVFYDYYSANVTISFNKSGDVTFMMKAIDELNLTGGWFNSLALSRALQMVRDKVLPFSRPEATNFVILAHFDDPTYLSYVKGYAQALKDRGVELFLLGMDSQQYLSSFELLASSPKDVLLIQGDEDIMSIVLAKICGNDEAMLQNSSSSCRMYQSVDLTFVVQDTIDLTPELFNTQLKGMLQSIVLNITQGPNKQPIRVALVTFGDTAVLQFNLDAFPSNVSAILQSLHDSVTYNGSNVTTACNIGAALEVVMAAVVPQTLRVNVPHMVVVITDGHVTDNPAMIAQKLQKSGAVIIAVALSPNITNGDKAKLKIIASSEDDVIIPDPDRLNDSLQRFVLVACQPTTILETPATCNANVEVDVTFLVDNSRVVSAIEFNQFVKNGLKIVINNLWNQSRARFAIVTYNDLGVNLPLNLTNNPNNKKDLFAIVDQLTYTGRSHFNNGKAALQKGLKTVRQVIVPTTRGGSIAHYVVVVFSDANSALTEASLLKQTGAILLPWGVDTKAGNSESAWNDMATYVRSNFSTKTVQNLENSAQMFSMQICNPVDVMTKGKKCNISQTLDLTFVGLEQSPNFRMSMTNTAMNVVKSIRESGNFYLRIHGPIQTIRNAQSFFNNTDNFMTFLNDSNVETLLMFLNNQIISRTIGLDVPHLVFIMLDGNFSSDNFTEDSVNRLRHTGAHVFVLGSSSEANRSGINALASSPDHVITQSNNASLFLPILSAACQSVHLNGSSNMPICNESRPLELTFVLDNSMSVSLEQFNVDFKSTIKLIANGLWNEGVRVSVVIAGGRQAWIAVPLYNTGKSGVEQLFSMLAEVQADDSYDSNDGNDDNIGKAYKIIRQKIVPLVRPGVPHVVITLAYSTPSMIPEARQLKKTGALLFSFNGPPQSLWESIASDIDYAMNIPDDPTELASSFAEAICSMHLKNNTQMCNVTSALDVTFVLQQSSHNFQETVRSMKRVVKSLSDKTNFELRLSVITYGNDNAAVNLNANQDFADVSRAFGNIDSNVTNAPEQAEGRNLSAGLIAVTTQIVPNTLRQFNISHLVIVFSDGYSSDNITGPANDLKATGAQIFAVSIGNDTNKINLNDIASTPNNVLNGEDLMNDSVYLQPMMNAVCKPVEISLSRRQEAECNSSQKLDLIFVLDQRLASSTGDFIVNIVGSVRMIVSDLLLNAQNDLVKFAVVLLGWSSNAIVAVNLDSSQQDVQALLDNLTTIDSSPANYNAQDAITDAMKTVLTTVLPKIRPDAKHIIIAMLNGKNFYSTSPVTDALRSTGTLLITITPQRLYKRMASDESLEFTMGNVQDILQKANIISKKLCMTFNSTVGTCSLGCNGNGMCSFICGSKNDTECCKCEAGFVGKRCEEVPKKKMVVKLSFNNLEFSEDLYISTSAGFILMEQQVCLPVTTAFSYKNSKETYNCKVEKFFKGSVVAEMQVGASDPNFIPADVQRALTDYCSSDSINCLESGLKLESLTAGAVEETTTVSTTASNPPATTNGAVSYGSTMLVLATSLLCVVLTFTLI